MKKLFWLLALALPMFVMTSCKDDEEVQPEDDMEIIYTEGIPFLHERLYCTNDDGTVTLTFGRFAKESEPTVAYVYTKNEEEARIFFHMLLPSDADFITEGDIEIGILTDKDHNETGRVYYTPNGDDGSYGRVTFSKSANVNPGLTAIVYMPEELKNENDIGTILGNISNIIGGGQSSQSNGCPLKAGMIYRYDNGKGYAYLCTRTATTESYGILWRINEKTAKSNFLQKTIYNMAYATPCRDVAQLLAADFNAAGDQYYQSMAAICGTSMKSIKGYSLYTHDFSHSDDWIRVFKLSPFSDWKAELTSCGVCLDYNESYWHYKSEAYLFYKSGNGTYTVRRDQLYWQDGPFLDIYKFKADEELMNKAKTITE